MIIELHRVKQAYVFSLICSIEADREFSAATVPAQITFRNLQDDLVKLDGDDPFFGCPQADFDLYCFGIRPW